ncbi:hypothetical protein GQ42DRAFT_162800 [Ramicandelaber brevisporus]|nr:hypothetical protein GQ42DRAFT_162800 [Ramicandelaber brevisporus]
MVGKAVKFQHSSGWKDASAVVIADEHASNCLSDAEYEDIDEDYYSNDGDYSDGSNEYYDEQGNPTSPLDFDKFDVPRYNSVLEASQMMPRDSWFGPALTPKRRNRTLGGNSAPGSARRKSNWGNQTLTAVTIAAQNEHAQMVEEVTSLDAPVEDGCEVTAWQPEEASVAEGSGEADEAEGEDIYGIQQQPVVTAAAKKPFVVQRSMRPLTIPQEPNITKARGRRTRKSLAPSSASASASAATASVTALLPPAAAPKSRSNVAPKLTVPVPFSFQNRQRAKPPTSTAAINTTKAAPARVPAKAGIPPPAAAAVSRPIQRHLVPTQPRSPALRTKMRARMAPAATTASSSQPPSRPPPFVARPVPPGIYKARDSNSSVTSTTSATSAASNRGSHSSQSSTSSSRSNPRGRFASPTKPKSTATASSSGDRPQFVLRSVILHEQRQREFQEKIAREREEEARRRRFVARPMPSDSPDRLPPVPERPLTIPDGFHLETDVRGEAYQANLRVRIEELNRRQEAARLFLAQPLPDFSQPFVPKPSGRPLTQHDDFVLKSDVRAAERAKFDEELSAREMLRYEMKQKQTEEQMERDRLEIIELRKQLVHHAKPLPALYQQHDQHQQQTHGADGSLLRHVAPPPPPPVIRSTKPLTMPETPRLLTRGTRGRRNNRRMTVKAGGRRFSVRYRG